MENKDIKKIQELVKQLKNSDETLLLLSKSSQNYSFFVKDMSEMIEDYDFRLQNAKSRGIEIPDLETLVNKMHKSRVDKMRVNMFEITSYLDSVTIYTDEHLTELYGIMRSTL